MVTILVFLSLVVCGLCYPTGHVGDSQEARRLYRLADKDFDNKLTRLEFHKIFMDFDLDLDKQVTSAEFIADWALRDLGPTNEAIVLFYNIDVNKDGVLTEAVDVSFIYKYFDLDNMDGISEAEFVIQWVKMSLA